MTRTSTYLRIALFALVSSAVCQLAVSPTLAARETEAVTVAGQDPAPASPPVLLTPEMKPYGHGYGEWAAKSWSWILGLRKDDSPAFDTDPQLAGNGQEGPVWFLAGTFEPGLKERHVTIPAGKALFLPLINNVWLSFPKDPPVTAECAQNNYECLRELVRPAIDAAEVSAEVDGVRVAGIVRFREESVVFQPTVPKANPFKLPGGLYGPCVDDGYYLMLAPLAAGTHVVHVTARTGDFAFELNYYLTILSQ